MSSRAKLVWFSLAALTISLVITPALPAEDAWEALVKGGHVALISHGNAPPGFGGDPPSFRFDDCQTQRNLDDKGRAQGKALGEAFRSHGVRVDRIVSSPVIDLQGDERIGVIGDFAEIFRRATGAGLKLRAHAGELRGAESVRATVFDHGVRQISHRVRAVDDPALVCALATEGVFLHVCPTSNVRLGCATGYGQHPLRALLVGGVRCTVNSDDPLLFGSDVLNEYRLLIQEMGFAPHEVAELAKTVFRASLLPKTAVTAVCDEIDAHTGNSGATRTTGERRFSNSP